MAFAVQSVSPSGDDRLSFFFLPLLMGPDATTVGRLHHIILLLSLFVNFKDDRLSG
jgi:hypothetical protein